MLEIGTGCDISILPKGVTFSCCANRTLLDRIRTKGTRLNYSRNKKPQPIFTNPTTKPHLFSNPLKLSPGLTTCLFLDDYENSFIEGYYLLSEKSHIVIKQQGVKSCGAACSLMILVDEWQRNKDKTNQNIRINPDFMIWFSVCDLTNGKLLQTKLKEEGLIPLILKFDHSSNEESSNEISRTIPFEKGQDILDKLKKIIEETKHSVIMSIEHPVIYGHWIVIDQITDDNFCYIRDSYTGKPYKVPSNELAGYIYNEKTGCQINEGICFL